MQFETSEGERGYHRQTDEGPVWVRVWHTLDVKSVTEYLRQSHAGADINVVGFTVHGRDATPMISLQFQHRVAPDDACDLNGDGLRCTHSAIEYGEFWLERRFGEDTEPVLYGEW